MADFLFLYRGGQRGNSPEESEQIMQKWMNWFKDLGASGNLKDGGQPLEDEGKVVASKGGPVTDGPYAEAKDLVGGYTLIEASIARSRLPSSRAAVRFSSAADASKSVRS